MALPMLKQTLWKVYQHPTLRWPIPYDDIIGVYEGSVVGALEVPRVPHHSTGPTALRACVHVEVVIRDDLEQVFHHLSEGGCATVILQFLVIR
jgi:hypothetical protein